MSKSKILQSKWNENHNLLLLLCKYENDTYEALIEEKCEELGMKIIKFSHISRPTKNINKAIAAYNRFDKKFIRS